MKKITGILRKWTLIRQLLSIWMLLVLSGPAIAVELKVSDATTIREQAERIGDPGANIAPEFSPERGIPMGLQCKTRNGVSPIRDAKAIGSGCAARGYSGVVIR